MESRTVTKKVSISVEILQNKCTMYAITKHNKTCSALFITNLIFDFKDCRFYSVRFQHETLHVCMYYWYNGIIQLY